jgi:hypothetical protein
MEEQIMTQNCDIKEMKVKNHLHIDTIYKCFEAPIIPGLSITTHVVGHTCHVLSLGCT